MFLGKKYVMIWFVFDSLLFYVHAYTCSPSYTDEERKTNVDSETACFRLLIKGLIVPIKTLCTVYSLILFCVETSDLLYCLDALTRV